MNVKVQIVIEAEPGEPPITQEVAQFQRETLQSASLGLALVEAKTILQGVQQALVEQQVSEYLTQQAVCNNCGGERVCKERRSIVYRTLFGKLNLQGVRLLHCPCQSHQTKSFSPLSDLLPQRSSPELLYLETKFASLMSYGLSGKLLEELLPISTRLNAGSVRHNLYQVAQRLEAELGEEQAVFIEGCPSAWAKLPRPDLPLTVGIDGGYVHSTEQTSKQDGWFEVIVGKSVTATGNSKVFGLVHSADLKPKRRVFEVMKSQGMQMNQQVTFLSDGGDTVRELQLYLNPNAEHLLDWFHITMRITVMKQMAKGLESEALKVTALKALEHMKWNLWHGKVWRALQWVDDLEMDLQAQDLNEKQRKVLKQLQEFRVYISRNRSFIPNYGERYRYGEAISTAFVESTVNQVVSKRMVKKQQMRWSKQGAHLLLQVRSKVLNEELQSTFQQWYPGFQVEAVEPALAT
ncbi:MAG TPA: ISKra4 family transposase [Leptolyngbyaceae cyanobacterium M33_DOE_097]|uniref:ISKra4 family transposase n=1 Tax=Oscillatoriales cyanobacterium SpSt-418 TaxID=2282169 RepID=A0A7C3PG92_9CYAN|nr:ISKra4 family transposase [Leptolyngbyaceae cyanobacterium M33_DOE_097]